MNLLVRKLTDVSLLQRANSFTTNKDSHMSLAKAYRYGHSPIRTQQFWIELEDIPLFVASQFVRSHVGVQFFQLSKRTDRGGKNFKEEISNINYRINEIATQDVSHIMTESEYDDVINGLNGVNEWIAELPENYDRYAPTNLAFICNAEMLINTSHKRLCNNASKETIDIFKKICNAIQVEDSDLYPHLVPQCVYRGVCPEPKCCGFIHTKQYKESRDKYCQLYK